MLQASSIQAWSICLPVSTDRETIARADDHRALRIWPRLLMVTGGNVTAIVDQLEKEGLVERLDEPADRRAFRIRLTRAGERSFGEMARAHEEWVVELLAGLSRREHEELLKLLAKVKQHAVEVTA